MSYLTFHTRHDEIRLTGVEVQHISGQAIDALGRELTCDYGPVRRALGLDGLDATDLRPRLGRLAGGIVEIPTSLPHRPVLKVDLFNLALDVWVTHRPEARVLAWLYHGCGRHVWIDRPDRNAFADRLQVALGAGQTRAGMGDPTGDVRVGGIVLPGGHRAGWEQVIAWLRAGSDPVVTSVSVADSFPNRWLPVNAGVWHPDPGGDGHDDQGDDDPWDRLNRTAQWDLCMRALAKLQPSRRWSPTDDTWWSPFTLGRLNEALRQIERHIATVGAGRG